MKTIQTFKNRLAVGGIHIIAVPITAYLFWLYIRAWVGFTAMPEFDRRPFVYRVLVPLLARLLSQTGLRLDVATFVIVGLSLAGFIAALYALYVSFGGDKTKALLIAYAAAWFLVPLMMYHRKVYDMTTVFLFALSFVFLLRGWFREYALLFPLVCLNRETAILLPLFFAVWYWRRMKRLSDWLLLFAYQVAAFAIIQGAIHLYYADLTGESVALRLVDNLQFFAAHLLPTALLLAVVILLFSAAHRSEQPFLRTAFYCMFPPLLVAYLVTGYGFEVRVFAEVYPVVVMLLVNMQGAAVCGSNHRRRPLLGERTL